jgi:uncharacterized membrane protein YkoI
MNRRTKFLIVAAVGAAALAGAAGIAAASNGDDGEAPITGRELEQASAVALAHTGTGKVTETEIGDEEGYYEVEVTLDDGSHVDVHLDENFNVLGTEGDGGGDDEGSEADSD